MASIINPFYIVFNQIDKSVREKSRHISGKVLDAGSGNSPYKKYFVCDEYKTLDICGKPDIKASIEKMPLESKSLDTIICTDVLEHVEDVEKAMQEMNRILRKNGKLVMTMPFMLGLHGAPYDYRRFTKYGFAQLMEKNGFKIIEIENIGNSWKMICQLANNELHKKYVSLKERSTAFALPVVPFWMFINVISNIGFCRRSDDGLGIICIAKKVK